VIRLTLLALLPVALLPLNLHAHGSGPDFGYSGVPGEASCTSCHGSGTGTGSVAVTFPNGMSYLPGVTQRLTVTVTDTAQRRWGFQLTARPATSPTTPGGTFTPGEDGFTQLTCTSPSYLFGAFATRCTGTGATQYPLQYIEQTDAGSRAGQPGPTRFTFDWTPPANASGSLVIYVAANAANNNAASSGDHIYTREYTLPPPGLPAISANGVVNAASFQNTITAGSWVAIQGTNLSATTRLWAASDFIGGINGALPTQLDGVKVTINGKPAFVEYVSPGLVNVQAPSGTATGPVPVQITNPSGVSQTVMANLQSVSPALFLWNGKYAAATRPDYSLVGPPNLFPGVTTIPARPGDVVILWATGFGPTSPSAVPAGINTPSDTLYSTSSPVIVMIGNIPATVLAAVLTPGNAGLYQIAVTVPPNAPAGDLPVIASIAGVQSPSGVLLTVLP
jgi:uncharacterized protein (TIGR03437 family)